VVYGDPTISHNQGLLAISIAISFMFFAIIISIHGIEIRGRQNVKVHQIRHECDDGSSHPAGSFIEDADPPSCLADEFPSEHENKKRHCKPKVAKSVFIGKFSSPTSSNPGFTMN